MQLNLEYNWFSKILIDVLLPDNKQLINTFCVFLKVGWRKENDFSNCWKSPENFPIYLLKKTHIQVDPRSSNPCSRVTWTYIITVIMLMRIAMIDNISKSPLSTFRLHSPVDDIQPFVSLTVSIIVLHLLHGRDGIITVLWLPCRRKRNDPLGLLLVYLICCFQPKSFISSWCLKVWKTCFG